MHMNPMFKPTLPDFTTNTGAQINEGVEDDFDLPPIDGAGYLNVTVAGDCKHTHPPPAASFRSVHRSAIPATASLTVARPRFQRPQCLHTSLFTSPHEATAQSGWRRR